MVTPQIQKSTESERFSREDESFSGEQPGWPLESPGRTGRVLPLWQEVLLQRISHKAMFGFLMGISDCYLSFTVFASEPETEHQVL